MSIHQSDPLELGSFSIHDIPHFAPVVGHLLLLLEVEVVIPSSQRVMEILHVASWMQSMPGSDARLSLARLEDKQQRVKPRHRLFEWHTQQCGGSYLVRV